MSFSGGPVFWLLAALGVAAIVVFFERLLELRRAQIDWQDFTKGVLNVMSAGNKDEALAICEDAPYPVANIAAAAIRHAGSSSVAMREAVDAQGRAEVSRLERRLASLAVIGQVAPLLGLLGTIIGFAKTVMLINGHEIVPRAELVSSAASATLVAAAGLAVAIPVAVMHACLRVRMDRIVADLESAATEIVGYFTSKEADK
jgi:biopolymer transport protein ExbB